LNILRQLSRPLSPEYPLGLFVAKAPDHTIIL
jgi:hypothetical protein